jgi:hypothetical protein
MSKGNPFVALRLLPDQQQALRARAVTHGVTVSELVRQAVGRYLAEAVDVDARKASRILPSLRLPSRPVRLQRAIDDLDGLLAEYEEWVAGLPENLQDTATSGLLSETVDNLQQAIELLNAITPPRGFGRD